jgi:hypothetical protein
VLGESSASAVARSGLQGEDEKATAATQLDKGCQDTAEAAALRAEEEHGDGAAGACSTREGLGRGRRGYLRVELARALAAGAG